MARLGKDGIFYYQSRGRRRLSHFTGEWLFDYRVVILDDNLYRVGLEYAWGEETRRAEIMVESQQQNVGGVR